MTITITQLRANLYKIVDQAIKTGVPVEITRKGKTIKLVPEKIKSKLANLTKHPTTIIGNPDDLVHMDWLDEWKGAQEL